MPKKLVCIEMEIVEPKGKQIHPSFTVYTMRPSQFLSHVKTVMEEFDVDESVSIKFTRRDWTRDEFETMVEAADSV